MLSCLLRSLVNFYFILETVIQNCINNLWLRCSQDREESLGQDHRGLSPALEDPSWRHSPVPKGGAGRLSDAMDHPMGPGPAKGCAALGPHIKVSGR